MAWASISFARVMLGFSAPQHVYVGGLVLKVWGILGFGVQDLGFGASGFGFYFSKQSLEHPELTPSFPVILICPPSVLDKIPYVEQMQLCTLMTRWGRGHGIGQGKYIGYTPS